MKNESGSVRSVLSKRVRLRCEFVTIRNIFTPIRTVVSWLGSNSGQRLNDQVYNAQNFAVAALTVGTGVGAHLADEHAPWVASAGVLSMALFNRRAHGHQLQQVHGEVNRLHLQMADIQRQMQEDRLRTQSRLATVATMSHEIRSPLSAVIALGDMLAKGRLSADEQNMVRDLVDAGRMVMNVVNDSLDYAKFESSSTPASPEDFSLRALVERVCRQTRLLALSKPDLSVEVVPSPVDWLLGHEEHLQQVLVNLCANGVKYSDSGVVRIHTEVVAEPDDPERLMLTVRVQDNGRGLTPSQQASLFKPFSQADTLERRAAQSSGLGLYLCQRIVEKMGGTIGVDSVLGQGSTFWFRIPVQRSRRPEAAQPSQMAAGMESGATASPLSGIRIGVADDARLNRELARRIIEAHGGECQSLESGNELMDKAAAGDLQIDLLLLDIEMPGIDGLAAAKRLRADPRYARLPIVAVSAVATEDIAGALKEGTLDGFLPKPFHAHALVQKIRAHLD